MSAKDVIANFLLHKELKLIRWVRTGPGSNLCETIKISDHEYCPKCATKCTSVYDRRKVRLKDEPVRGKSLALIITKRRFYCKQCRMLQPLSTQLLSHVKKLNLILKNIF